MQTAFHERFERRRDTGSHAGKRRRLPFHDGGDRRRLTVAGERSTAGEHFVEKDAERENIGARVGRPPFELFRRHVLRCADEVSQLRDRGVRWRNRRSVAILEQLRDAEVEQLRAIPGQRDVGGFEVPVHDSVTMRLGQCARDLASVAQHVLDGERSVDQPLGQRCALEILHDEERQAVLVADVVQRADVRMIQAGNRAGFSFEARQRVRVRRRGAENLDRDRPAEACVARLVDLAHSAGADQVLDLVGAQSCAGFQLLHDEV